MELRNIPLADIIPNNYNPNKVDEEIMQQLKKTIQRDGFLQPLLLRKDPEQEGKYSIIDGEHRYRILLELEKTEAPSIVLEKDDDMSKILTINMNKLRGSFDIVKLAEVIHSLKTTYSVAEIEDLLGYKPDELQKFDDLLDFDIKKYNEEEKNQAEHINRIQADENKELVSRGEFSVMLTSGQLDMIESAIDTFTKHKNKAEALFMLASKHLQDNFPEKHLEVTDRIKTYNEKVDNEETVLTEKSGVEIL